MKLLCLQGSTANRNFLPAYFVRKIAKNLCTVRIDKLLIHGNALGFLLGLQQFRDIRKSLPFSGKYFLLFLSHEMFLNTRVCIKVAPYFMLYRILSTKSSTLFSFFNIGLIKVTHTAFIFYIDKRGYL